MRVSCAMCGAEMSPAPDARINLPSVFAPVLRGGGPTTEEIARIAGFIEVYLCEECLGASKTRLREDGTLPVSEWDIEAVEWDEAADPDVDSEGDGPPVVDDDFEFIEDSYYVVTNSEDLDLSDTAVFEAELVKAIHKQTDLGAS